MRRQMSVVSYAGRGVVRRTLPPSSSTDSMLLPFKASVTTDISFVSPLTRLKLAIIFSGTAGSRVGGRQHTSQNMANAITAAAHYTPRKQR